MRTTGEVAEEFTVVNVEPSVVETIRTYEVTALVPVSVGVFHVMVSPPLVGVATKESTRPGTPPVAYVRATASMIAASAIKADCCPANAEANCALSSDTD